MHSFEVSLGYESVERTTFSKECIQFLNVVSSTPRHEQG